MAGTEATASFEQKYFPVRLFFLFTIQHTGTQSPDTGFSIFYTVTSSGKRQEGYGGYGPPEGEGYGEYEYGSYEWPEYEEGEWEWPEFEEGEYPEIPEGYGGYGGYGQF